MSAATESLETLISLPGAAATHFRALDLDRPAITFVASDPPGTQLGSGGGTAHLLAAAARAAGAALEPWLAASRKLVIHGSGESRRLPSYAAAGKPLTPMPRLRPFGPQRPDPLLIDLQIRAYERFLWHAPPHYRVMIACGDVLVHDPGWLPAYPLADVLIVGLPANEEEAAQHGVMVCQRDAHDRLLRFLQKPDAATLHAEAGDNPYFLDTGIWLLSARALNLIFRKCGWSDPSAVGTSRLPAAYDLYTQFGPALGSRPALRDPEVQTLSCSVLPLPKGRFYHFGTNRSLLASVAQLQRPATEERSVGHSSMQSLGQPVLLNADVTCALTDENRFIWIENASVPASWTLTERHVITGVPANNWALQLPPGTCLDLVPLPGNRLCLRAYGFDDPFRGPIGQADTLWQGQPALAWFRARGLTPEQCDIPPNTDLQAAPLFPVLPAADLPPGLLQWLITPPPQPAPALAQQWLTLPRLSATDLLNAADVPAIFAQRLDRARQQGPPENRPDWDRQSASLDLKATATFGRRCGWPPAEPAKPVTTGLAAAHTRMYQSRQATLRGDAPTAARYAQEAFAGLRQCFLDELHTTPANPFRQVQEDQIVWGRAPVRLDLAGGWTDTPPFCIEHGGRVVNVAVDLNGQPPIQVFARASAQPGITIRSIDLGIGETISDYATLERFGALGSGFSIARAALALAGFLPRFNAGAGHTSLAQQLEQDFGGGIELSLLAAVPKGSGLGTSSILAATLLGTLSELCGLQWTPDAIFTRTLVLEQLLTSGGGWQDQIGGISSGLKQIETQPGLRQQAVVRGLPDRLLRPPYANRRVLLYYTGITRVAHDILGEIVKNLFLNDTRTTAIIEAIGQNARFAADAAQRDDWPDLCEAVNRSWTLNQMLDAGTLPASVADLLTPLNPFLSACKLLGAGGGGYMLLLARDENDGQRIRELLTTNPPNPRARFVDFSVSDTGFQVTRS